MKPRCKMPVWRSGIQRHEQCQLSGTREGGYCYLHTPEARARRDTDLIERAKARGAMPPHPDSLRLDWLAEAAIHPLELDRMGGVDAPVGPMFLTFDRRWVGPNGENGGEREQYSAPTLREVIDKVRAKWDAARSTP